MGTKMNPTVGQPKVRSFSECSPKVRSLVLKAARVRERAAWGQIKSSLLAESPMGADEIRRLRQIVRRWHELAAIWIVETGAATPGSWETWRQAMQEVASRLDDEVGG